MVMRENSTLERFRNRREALDWLQVRVQISQGKFYQDCAAGLLTIHPDKSISKFQVVEYGESLFGLVWQGPSYSIRKRIARLYRPPSVGLSDVIQG